MGVQGQNSSAAHVILVHCHSAYTLRLLSLLQQQSRHRAVCGRKKRAPKPEMVGCLEMSRALVVPEAEASPP